MEVPQYFQFKIEGTEARTQSWRVVELSLKDPGLKSGFSLNHKLQADVSSSPTAAQPKVSSWFELHREINLSSDLAQPICFRDEETWPKESK